VEQLQFSSGSKSGVSVSIPNTATGSDVDDYVEALYKRMLGQSYTDLSADA